MENTGQMRVSPGVPGTSAHNENECVLWMSGQQTSEQNELWPLLCFGLE